MEIEDRFEMKTRFVWIVNKYIQIRYRSDKEEAISKIIKDTLLKWNI